MPTWRRPTIPNCQFMKIISQNIRGINGQNKHHLLRNRIQNEKLDILMRQETKRNTETMKKIVSKIWKTSEVHSTHAQDTSGGLTIIWNPSNVIIQEFLHATNSITKNFKIIGSDIEGTLTNIYWTQLIPQNLELLN